MKDDVLLRYSRQILLPEIDMAGQQKLAAASVLIVGAGGLGSPAAMYLAAAGVGELRIADPDVVELSNLQRQIMHDTETLGRPKTESARRCLARLNPEVAVTGIQERLGGAALASHVAAVDLVLDCSDNFATRFSVNAECVRYRRPLVSGAVIRFEGQLAVFDASRGSACYNCLYPEFGESEDTCARSGVVAALPGIIGSWQALEAIKLIVGVGPAPLGRLVVFDGLRGEINTLKFQRDPNCATCGGFRQSD